MKTASFYTYQGPGRICIARYAPRNTPPGYRYYKALAPGEWFRETDQAEYRRLYFAEVLGRLDPEKTVMDLCALAQGAEPVLLCYERPPFTDKNWCHRRMVTEWLLDKLGLEVAEIGAAEGFAPTRQLELPVPLRVAAKQIRQCVSEIRTVIKNEEK